MEKNKTAVEWLIVELNSELNYIPITQWDRIRDLIQRAKEMDKEQKKDAWVDGNHTQRCIANKEVDECFDNYYTEVYGSNKMHDAKSMMVGDVGRSVAVIQAKIDELAKLLDYWIKEHSKALDSGNNLYAEVCKERILITEREHYVLSWVLM
jgi:hypothetical protein